jgi:two-component system, OmpR family, sensor histidine kinase KdpD
VLLNWFFAPPIHTFTISNGRDLLALFAFLVVAAVISALVDLAARRRSDAYRARTEAQALARMAAVVLREPDPLPKLVEDLVTAFRLDGAAVIRAAREGWIVEAEAGPHPPSSPVDSSLSVPLSPDVTLVLMSPGLRAEDRQVLDAFVTQLGIALESRRLQGEAAQAETLARGNELRTALLAAVSHDLRTPLASIKAAATSLLSKDVEFEPAEVDELLATIDEETDRLNRLVDNLLDMSRLQTGALLISAEGVGVDEIVALAVASLPSAARIELDVPETLPRVVVDAALLERALANLLANSLAFSPDGQPVQVHAGAVGGRVELRIVDRGCGIAPADRDRVFQPFQRLGDSPEGEGVGLGMAVARGFVEANHGELTIEDTPGGGCTVVLSLPAAPQ